MVTTASLAPPIRLSLAHCSMKRCLRGCSANVGHVRIGGPLRNASRSPVSTRPGSHTLSSTCILACTRLQWSPISMRPGSPLVLTSRNFSTYRGDCERRRPDRRPRPPSGGSTIHEWVASPQKHDAFGPREPPLWFGRHWPARSSYSVVIERGYPMIVADLSVRVIRRPSVSIWRSLEPPAGPSGAKSTWSSE